MNFIIAIVTLILVLTAVGCSSGLSDAAVYYNEGNASARQELWEEAISDYDNAIQLDPEFAMAYVNRGWVYLNIGNHQGAFNDFEEAIRLNLTDKEQMARAYSGRGYANDELGEVEKALEDFDTAIQLDPDLVESYINRGTVYIKTGQYENALEDFDKAIQLDPDDPYSYYNRGIVLEELGRHSLAEEDSNKACELDRSLC